jgi:uncharacterized protein YprB with RNaseH-like and TPR domain/predicted nuclease with RNAse H fold/dephospho-CoA kinase
LGLQIEESQNALAKRDIAHFAKHLERREHFRLALSFPDETLFLDIESTGLSRYYDHITEIGWSLGKEYGFFVRGQRDGEFRDAIAAAKIVVTFNGSLFDLPFIQKEFVDLQLPAVHVDLRFLSKRAGFPGGQKEVERLLGIERPADVSSITGEAAPVLWHRYRRGDNDSLQMLLKYNHADIRGMKQIFDKVSRSLLTSYGLGLMALPSFATMEFPDSEEYLSKSFKRVVKPFVGSTKPIVRIDELEQIPRLKVVGIDLSGSEGKASGWCFLDGREATTFALHGDEEIVAQTIKERPNIISIDSPLSLPAGRKIVADSDPGRTKYGIVRFCERVLKRRGVNVYPALIRSMQNLTARGMRLAQTFRSLGYPVIESYPGAAQDILGIPRKRASLEFLERGLAEFGVSGKFVSEPVSHDELDAITSAIVGVFFWAGMYERLGAIPFGDEALIIPDLKADIPVYQSSLVIGFSGALGAGKTTAARLLEQQYGFSYGRYSEVIEERVRRKKKDFDRFDLQVEGQRVFEKYGQRWLGQQLLTKLSSNKRITIDGLRFPDDHAYLTEMFGSRFLHIHLIAPKNVRKKRTIKRHGRDFNFEKADSHEVEQKIESLKGIAKHVIENTGSIEALHHKLTSLCRI